MPCLRTQCISVDSLAAPRPRSRWSSFGIALALTTASHTAHAVPTWFEGLVQTAPPYQSVVPIQNNLFERQHYTAVGARVGFQPWVWDPVALEWVYAVAPDETWTWQW